MRHYSDIVFAALKGDSVKGYRFARNDKK